MGMDTLRRHYFTIAAWADNQEARFVHVLKSQPMKDCLTIKISIVWYAFVPAMISLANEALVRGQGLLEFF